MDWTTIESDPGVFTELVRNIGVKDVGFEELYSLDVADLVSVEPVLGLIFLFKWTKNDNYEATIDHEAPLDLFFAKQVVTNACATQAILSVLLNAHDRVELGDELSQFREFTQEFDAETKGLAVSNSEVIRTAHNSFARPEPIVIQSRPATDDDDVFHFVAYVPKDGFVFELDGLREGPINHGPFGDSNWLEVAVPAIQRRIENYATQEIKFNLLAVTEDARKRLRERLAELSALGTSGADFSGEKSEIESRLEREEAKEARWRDENIRRRHNYLPLILSLLKELATKGELQSLIDQARAKHT